MSIPLSDVLFFGGGQCLQRFGTLSWRTSLEQDRGSVEQYTRAGTVPAIGRDGAVRYVGANVPPVEWVDSDSDGDRDLATVLFQRALWPLGWALSGLSGEYALGVRAGQAPSVVLPANWGANEFAAVGIVVPGWVHTDGEDHVVAEWYLTANDRIQLYKAADNSLKAYIVAGGVAATATLSKSLTAGVPFFVGLRARSGTLYLYADTDADADLDAASVAVGTFGSGTWTLYLGASQAGADHLEGFVNLLIASDGSADATTSGPIFDRFNAGAGMAVEEWMNRHSDKLVLSVDGTSSAYRMRTAYASVPAVVRNGIARWVDWTPMVKSAAVNVLRNRHRWTANDGITYRTTLLGRAYTNLVSSDNLSTWNKLETPVVTPGISDPMGGVTAYTVADDDATLLERIARSVTFTGDGVKSFVWVVCERTMPATGSQSLVLYDNTAPATRADLTITAWVNGKPTVSCATGTLLFVIPKGFGYWAIGFQSTSGTTAANLNSLLIAPATTANQTGSIDVWRVNAFNDPIPPQDILDASAVRAEDGFVDAYTAPPQAATYLVEGVVADLANQGTARTFWNLGNGAGATAAIRLYHEAAAARLVIAYHNGTSEVTGYWNVTLDLGDRYSVRFHQAASGAIDAVGLKVNALAEDTTLDGAFASTLALPAAWAAEQIAYAGTNATANSAHTKCVSSSGAEKSLAAMQALAPTDASVLYQYRSGQISELATVTVGAGFTETDPTCYFPWPYGTGVGAFTLLVDMDELGALLGAGGVLHIGAADATTGARVTLESTGAFYRLTHSNGSASAVATLAAAPSYGNRERLRCVINPNGSVLLGQTIGTGTETTAADATAVPFASAWAAQRLYVGCAGTTKAGDLRLRAIRAARGVQTVADMEGIFA